MAVRESRPLKPRPLRSCTGRQAIRFLRGVSARLLAPFEFFLADLYPLRQVRRLRPSPWATTHGGVDAVPIFPVTLYVILISFLALVLVPFADLLDVLACLHMVMCC
jgi:hypothetical protein